MSDDENVPVIQKKITTKFKNKLKAMNAKKGNQVE